MNSFEAFTMLLIIGIAIATTTWALTCLIEWIEGLGEETE